MLAAAVMGQVRQAVRAEDPNLPIARIRGYDEILRAKERLGDTPFAIELRHASWFNDKNRDRTLAFLTDNEIPFVMVDAPPGTKSSAGDRGSSRSATGTGRITGACRRAWRAVKHGPAASRAAASATPADGTRTPASAAGAST